MGRYLPGLVWNIAPPGRPPGERCAKTDIGSRRTAATALPPSSLTVDQSRSTTEVRNSPVTTGTDKRMRFRFISSL